MCPATPTSDLIDGRAIARALKQEVVADVAQLRQEQIPCGLAVVSVGDVYSAAAYERRLARLATELGLPYRRCALPGDCTEAEVLSVLDELNQSSSVSGILVLRPLPAQIRESEVFERLDVLKDVEAVHPENAGLLALGDPRYVPSTAASTFHVLDTWLTEQGEDLSDFYRRSSVLVVGRSANVGKPAVSLAYARQMIVLSVDEWASNSGRLAEFTRAADVVVVAAGVPGLINADHLKPGAVVLDVGINASRDAGTGQVRMVGDVDTDSALTVARAVTPVPGGIGPVTDVWLIRNTLAAARNLTAGSIPEKRLEMTAR